MLDINFQSYDNNATEPLCQWDVNQKISIKGIPVNKAPTILFSNRLSVSAEPVPTQSVNAVITCEIPNALLTEPYPITAYVRITEDGTTYTIGKIRIPVLPQKKPDDYVYTENIAVMTYSDVLTYMETRLDIERKRIDALLALPGDGTVQDAILEDMKIGYDGTVWETPGDAMRGQVSQVYEDMGNIDVSGSGGSATEYIEGDYKLNTLFDLDFEWFDGIKINSDGSEMSNSSYTTTDYIPVSPDMKIDDFFSSAYQNTFAFYDKKKNFIALATAGESIPDKAAYMRYYTQISTIEATVDSFKTRGTFKFWRQFPTDQTDRNLGIPAKKSLMDTIYNPLKAVATVNFYGDSNTYGYGVDQKSWAYYIAKRLKDTFNGTKLYYYGGSPYVQVWGMNTTASLASLCMKSLSGSTISDASPFIKFKTNTAKVYCGWQSASNGSSYAILVDGVVQESGSVASTGAYETEIELDGDVHTIVIKPYGKSTINNPYFAIDKQISFNNYGKAGVTSQNLPVTGLDTCDFAIVLIGTNDGNNNVYTGIQNGVTLHKFGDYADKCIFIEPLFKCDGNENSHVLCNNHISQLCDLMGIRHLRLDSLAAIFGLQYVVLMQSDGSHYTTQGHLTIANAISTTLGFATNYKTDYADTDTIGNIFDNLGE